MTKDKGCLKLKFRDLLKGEKYHCSDNFYIDQYVDLGALGFVASSRGARRSPIILGNRFQVEVQPGDYIVQYAGFDQIAEENRCSAAELFLRVRLYAVKSVDAKNRTIECEVPEVIPGHLKFESGRLVDTYWEPAGIPEEAE